jgi:hypothetical protein
MLRIRYVYLGSEFSITDPGSKDSALRNLGIFIPDPRSDCSQSRIQGSKSSTGSWIRIRNTLVLPVNSIFQAEQRWRNLSHGELQRRGQLFESRVPRSHGLDRGGCLHLSHICAHGGQRASLLPRHGSVSQLLFYV